MMYLGCRPSLPFEMVVVPGFPYIPKGEKYFLKSKFRSGVRNKRRQC
jgi:hypothetical protein